MPESTPTPLPDVSTVSPSSDLIDTKVILKELIKAHREGPKSRERALIITKLQEALMWTEEAFMLE